jgi:hypothetical protein
VVERAWLEALMSGWLNQPSRAAARQDAPAMMQAAE